MNKALLITRPDHDLATNYLFFWSQFVIQEARKRQIKVLDLKKGVNAFIGYRRNFFLCYSQQSISQPLKDKIAKIFLEPSNRVPISLLKGKTAKQSYQKSQDAMLRNFRYLLSSKASLIQRDTAPYLWINRKYQVILGKSSAKI